jgi:hypothetical protein
VCKGIVDQAADVSDVPFVLPVAAPSMAQQFGARLLKFSRTWWQVSEPAHVEGSTNADRAVVRKPGTPHIIQAS